MEVWLWVAFSFWQVEGKIRWRGVRGGERSVIEGFFGEFLKRRIKDFDRYFPIKKGLGSLRRRGSSFTKAPSHRLLWWTRPG